jgi:hypothetical protein
MTATEFSNDIQDNGLEHLGRYYGSYLAKVVDANDPESRGRITVMCAEAYGDHESPFCECQGISSLNASGIVCMPKVDDLVYISFKNGRINEPIWNGGTWSDNELPKDLSNITIFTEGGARVDLKDSGVVIKSKKSIVTVHNDGTVTIEADTIKLGKNASEAAVKGNELVNLITKLLTVILPTYSNSGGPLIPPPSISTEVTGLNKLLSKVVSLK